MINQNASRCVQSTDITRSTIGTLRYFCVPKITVYNLSSNSKFTVHVFWPVPVAQ